MNAVVCRVTKVMALSTLKKMDAELKALVARAFKKCPYDDLMLTDPIKYPSIQDRLF